MPSFGDKRGRDDVDDVDDKPECVRISTIYEDDFYEDGWDDVDDVDDTISVEVTTSDDENFLKDPTVHPTVHRHTKRKLTDEEIDEYYTQFFSSKGFIVPEYGGLMPGGIGPYGLFNESRKQRVTDMAKLSLQFYNHQKKASFEFHELVRVNACAVAGLMFFITFTARSADNAPQTFYGKVWEKLDDTKEVQFCEMDTKQEPGTS